MVDVLQVFYRSGNDNTLRTRGMSSYGLHPRRRMKSMSIISRGIGRLCAPPDHVCRMVPARLARARLRPPFAITSPCAVVPLVLALPLPALRASTRVNRQAAALPATHTSIRSDGVMGEPPHTLRLPERPAPCPECQHCYGGQLPLVRESSNDSPCACRPCQFVPLLRTVFWEESHAPP